MFIKKKDIDILASLECGQIFRYEILDKGEYVVYSLDEKCSIIEKQDDYIINSTNDEYFYKFFNLDLDYDHILTEITKNPYLKNTLKADYKKLRILKQDPIETIISFIISANNNIPRIKGIISRLCRALGKEKDGYYSFPTIDALAMQNVEFYKSIGLGYRAPYILESAKMIKDGFDINKIYNLDSNKAKEELLKLPGVGPKVCDCILLFAYNKYDVFPVDTWIKKVYQDIYHKEDSVSIMRDRFIKDFGEYAGIAQQFLFYNKREK